MRKKLILGVSGVRGSFSEEAALHFSKKNNLDCTLEYLVDMEGVLSAFDRNAIDLGVFPVVNNNAGLVQAAFIAMGKRSFTYLENIWLEINHCLLAKPGIQLQQIQKIISYPQALLQCKQYLGQHFKNAELVEWDDTAKAANDLAKNILDDTSAVIASESCAKIYGLSILEKNIQDINPNMTAFILVKK